MQVPADLPCSSTLADVADRVGEGSRGDSRRDAVGEVSIEASLRGDMCTGG